MGSSARADFAEREKNVSPPVSQGDDCLSRASQLRDLKSCCNSREDILFGTYLDGLATLVVVDEEREAEAVEWSEATIGDVADAAR